MDKAKKSFPGFTRTESELKLFELKFISSKAENVLRSLGRVQKSLDAISSLVRRGIRDNWSK